MLAAIFGFLAKAFVFLLRGMVYLAGGAAVLIVLLIPLKFIIGKLAGVLGVGGGGGSSSGIGSAIGNGLNTAVKTIDTAIGGVFKGIGTVFNGTANTAGMVRDKLLGERHGGRGRRNDYYDENYGRRGRSRRNSNYDYDDYYNNQYSNNRQRNNRYNEQYSQQSPVREREHLLQTRMDGTFIEGDPNNPDDKYYNVIRYYDEYGFDQFGFNKKGEHKETLMKEYLSNKSKVKLTDVFGDKVIADNQAVDSWIRNMQFKKPGSWVPGMAGLSYAAVHTIGKALKLNVPDEWKDLDDVDSGITDPSQISQETINESKADLSNKRRGYAENIEEKITEHNQGPEFEKLVSKDKKIRKDIEKSERRLKDLPPENIEDAKEYAEEINRASDEEKPVVTHKTFVDLEHNTDKKKNIRFKKAIKQKKKEVSTNENVANEDDIKVTKITDNSDAADLDISGIEGLSWSTTSSKKEPVYAESNTKSNLMEDKLKDLKEEVEIK